MTLPPKPNLADWTDEQLLALVRRHGNLTLAAKAAGVGRRCLGEHIGNRGLADQVKAMRSKAAGIEIDLILDAIRKTGTLRGAASWLSLSYTSMYDRLTRAGVIDEAVSLAVGRHAEPNQKDPSETAGVFYEDDGNSVRIVEPATPKVKLGDVAVMIRERGLDPDEWVVANVGLREWDALTKSVPGKPVTIRLRQWQVTLRRAPHLLLALPAQYFPASKRTPGPPASEKPETILVEGDHQIPYMNEELHAASLEMVRTLVRKHRLAEVDFLGDTNDFPTISRHADHPSTATAEVNSGVQKACDMLKEKRAAAPGARMRKLKGNHDWRIEGELLLRSERMYGIKPAQWDKEVELPALSLVRLLHLDKLDVELVEDPRGWEHAELEIVGGPGGLIVRHGWLTGANSAKNSMLKRGRSMIVGHTHRREHIYAWDPSMGIERQAATAGCMCLVRNERFPHYAVCDNWLQGNIVVTRWPDDRFMIEHGIWDGSHLAWRDLRFRG